MKFNPMSRQTRCFLLIFLCFLWTSAGYLSWLYRLMEVLPDVQVELAAEMVGYLLQALGLLAFALLVRKWPAFAKRLPFALTIVLDLLCLVLAVLLKGPVPILTFGLCMNLFHGLLAGFYLQEPAGAGLRPGVRRSQLHDLASVPLWQRELSALQMGVGGILPVGWSDRTSSAAG